MLNIDGLEFTYIQKLWIADIQSAHGHHEVLLEGDEDSPDSDQVEVFCAFKKDLDANLAEMRRSIFLASLCRPIRIFVNNENRVAVQFKNLLTGSQRELRIWK